MIVSINIKRIRFILFMICIKSFIILYYFMHFVFFHIEWWTLKFLINKCSSNLLTADSIICLLDYEKLLSTQFYLFYLVCCLQLTVFWFVWIECFSYMFFWLTWFVSFLNHDCLSHFSINYLWHSTWAAFFVFNSLSTHTDHDYQFCII